jgi:hypothetical protein
MENHVKEKWGHYLSQKNDKMKCVCNKLGLGSNIIYIVIIIPNLNIDLPLSHDTSTFLGYKKGKWYP